MPAALLLVAEGVSHFLWPHHPSTSPPEAPAGVASLALMSVFANPWEEIGWRAFAFTRLEATHKPLFAALIVGVLWGLWHIPFFVWTGNPMSGFPFWPWFVAIVARSIILGWLYNRAGLSLAVAVVFHVASNVFGAIIGINSHASLAIVNVIAALIVLGFSGAQLAKAPAANKPYTSASLPSERT